MVTSTLCRIGDVCAVRKGTTITEKEATCGEVPVVAGGMKPSYFHGESNRQPGVITISASGANAGFVSYWGCPIWASDCTSVEPINPSLVSPRYVFHFLKSIEATVISSFRRGAAQPHVYARDLQEIMIPLPPIEEQRRIASILDAADALRTKRRQALAKLETLSQAIFIDMFGDPMVNPRNLPVHPLRDLIKLSSGNGLYAKNMKPGPYLVYGGNGVSGVHDQFMFEEPQIVIGRVGVYCGCVHVTEPFSWITDNALYVTRMEAGLNRTYLVAALREANLNQFADQAAQPLISGSRVYPLPIMVPSIDEQLCFEKVIGSVAAFQRKLSVCTVAVETLFASLQDRAFRGEL